MSYEFKYLGKKNICKMAFHSAIIYSRKSKSKTRFQNHKLEILRNIKKKAFLELNSEKNLLILLNLFFETDFVINVFYFCK